MSKKKLDTSTITNELRGHSVFFPKERETRPDQEQQLTPPSQTEQNISEKQTHDTVIPRYHETMVSTMQPWCNLALDGNLNLTSIIDLLSKNKPIGIGKPVVRAKGINHPK